MLLLRTTHLVSSPRGRHFAWAAGHMRLRAILNREPAFPSAFKGAPVIAQFSSLGSIDDKWCVRRPGCGPAAGAAC